MKKIVIATPVDFSNFGNRLQNYSVHRICKKMGYSPITLAVEYSYVFGVIPKHLVLHIISSLKLKRILSHIPALKKINKSIAAWDFTQKEIKTTFINSTRQYLKAVEGASLFGIGGDQVLSPYWNRIIWFSTFKEQPSQKKICFGPSFGQDILPKEYLETVVKNDVSQIAYPAFREQSGCDIAYQYLNVKPVHICDPVVMIKPEEWLEVVKGKSISYQEKYILVYFLGNVSSDYIDYIDKQKREGFKVIDVSINSYESDAACDPLMFVSLISSANYVFTDSYHAIMLALILNTNLVIFNRNGGESMNTRIIEIVQKYNLESCLFDNCKGELLPNYDKNTIQQILERERDIADEYYKNFFQNE